VAPTPWLLRRRPASLAGGGGRGASSAPGGVKRPAPASDSTWTSGRTPGTALSSMRSATRGTSGGGAPASGSLRAPPSGGGWAGNPPAVRGSAGGVGSGRGGVLPASTPAGAPAPPPPA